jgi:hypothetical protein
VKVLIGISKFSGRRSTIPPSFGKGFSFFDTLKFQAWFNIRRMCVTPPEMSNG